MSIAPLRLGLTATPPGPGPAATRLRALLGPVVFERSIAELAGPYLAPLERISLAPRARPRGAPRVRRAPGRLPARRGGVPRQPPRRALGGLPPARVADRRRAARGRGLAAARRLLAFPRRKREALASLLRATGGQDAGLRRRQRDGLRGRARAPGHAAHLRHRPARSATRRWPDSATRRAARARLGAGAERRARRPRGRGRDRRRGRMGEREHVQRVGRLLRPGAGKEALVFDPVTRGTVEVRQARRRREGLAPRSEAPR